MGVRILHENFTIRARAAKTYCLDGENWRCVCACSRRTCSICLQGHQLRVNVAHESCSIYGSHSSPKPLYSVSCSSHRRIYTSSSSTGVFTHTRRKQIPAMSAAISPTSSSSFSGLSQSRAFSTSTSQNFASPPYEQTHSEVSTDEVQLGATQSSHDNGMNDRDLLPLQILEPGSSSPASTRRYEQPACIWPLATNCECILKFSFFGLFLFFANLLSHNMGQKMSKQIV